MASQRPASDQDNQKAARALPSPRPRSFADSITTPLYSTTVSQSLRKALRSHLYTSSGDQVIQGLDGTNDIMTVWTSSMNQAWRIWPAAPRWPNGCARRRSTMWSASRI